MTKPLLSLAVSIQLLAVSLTAQAQNAELEAFVDGIAAEHVGNTLVGLSVGVSRGEEILLHKSYGLANIEWQVPMPLNAVHEIGSVTKQFTAVAMLQLYGQERLDLNADISAYLPDFDTQGRSIPVRRLLDHTSGMKGYTEIEEFFELFSRDAPRDELLRMIERYPFDFEPGEALIYNNSAYFLMGLIIEEITGQSYEDYLMEHVFPLAGMGNSSYCSNKTITPNKASGYGLDSDEFVIANYHNHTWPYAAGSLCSTVADLLAWNQALHHGEVLSPALYDMLITPVPLNDGTEVHYAMGVTHYDHPTGRVIEHGGAIDGFLSHSRYYPDEDVTVVVLQNTGAPPGPAAVANQIGEQLFGTPMALTPRLYEGDLARYEGTYEGAARGATLSIQITAADGALQSARTVRDRELPPDTLNYLEGDTFFEGSNRFIFDEAAGGEIGKLRLAGPSNHYVLERVSE